MDAPLPTNLVSSWEDFLKTEESRSPGEFFYEDIFTHPVLFPLQRIYELSEMLKVAKRTKPKTIVEVGSDKGGGFYHWIKSLSPKKAIAIEIRGTPFIDQFSSSFPKNKIVGFPASSYSPETVQKVKDFLDGDTIDCLFLDGDKGNFKADYDAYLPLMSKGGLIFIHDIVDEILPKKFWESLRDNHALSCIIDCRDLSTQIEKYKQTAYGGWLAHWKNTSCGVGIAVV